MSTARAQALATVAAIAGALALYAGALHHPFVGDDQLAVAANPTVAAPSAAGLRALWTSDYWRGVDAAGRVTEMSPDRNLYRPVTVLSFWLTSAAAGVDPGAFRLVNLLLHALAAVLVGVLCRLWGARGGALIAGALVLVHPVATDVVNRIVGRADILALVGVVGFLAAQRAAQRHGWTWTRTLAAWLSAGLALGAKESGIIVVPLAVMQAWLGREPRGRVRHHWRGAGALAGALAPYLLGRALAVALPAYPATSTWDLGGNPVWGARLAVRVPVACALAWDYAVFMLRPLPLLAFDVPPTVPTWGDASAWCGVLVLGVLAVAAAALGVRRRPLSLGLVWWLAAFAVVSQLPISIGAYREVRFAYALVAAYAFCVGGLAERALARGPLVRAVVLVVVLGWGGLAARVVVQRNADFESLRALVAADVRQRPASPAALIRLANIEEQAGHDAAAERLLERVRELAPASAQACYELADFHQRRGDLVKARALHEEAVALNPRHYLSLMALGNLALAERDLGRAATMLERAAAIAPDDPYVVYNLAVLDDARGERTAAIARLSALVARRPDFGLAVRGLEALRAAAARGGG